MTINDFRDFLQSNDFYYAEVDSVEERSCCFYLMTNKEGRVVQVVYDNDPNYGTLSFSKANILISPFDFIYDCLQSMVLLGKYDKVYLNRGKRIVNFPENAQI